MVRQRKGRVDDDERFADWDYLSLDCGDGGLCGRNNAFLQPDQQMGQGCGGANTDGGGSTVAHEFGRAGPGVLRISAGEFARGMRAVPLAGHHAVGTSGLG